MTGIDLGAPIQRLVTEGLLLKGGGHKMAAGLTVAEDKLEAAMARLAELLAKQGADRARPRDLRVEGALMPGAATIELVEHDGTSRAVWRWRSRPALCVCGYADLFRQAGGRITPQSSPLGTVWRGQNGRDFIRRL